MTMTATNKKIWCSALRSGEYKQGQSRLIRDRGARGYEYCCLGVAIEELVDGEWEVNERIYGPPTLHFDGKVTRLSDRIMNQLGLSNTAQHQLINMNDRDRLTFPQIADRIEKDPTI